MRKPKLCSTLTRPLNSKNLMDKTYKELVDFLQLLDCAPYLINLTKKTQKDQSGMIKQLQKFILNKLLNQFTNITWTSEYKPDSMKRDSIDIYGSHTDFEIIIELDKYRADQIAKKFLSRSALFNDKKIIYIALCYGGTAKMNVPEAIKYFTYCNTISLRLENLFAGLIVEK